MDPAPVWRRASFWSYPTYTYGGIVLDKIVKWDVLINWDPIWQAEGVTFLRDFGPWRVGQRVHSLIVDFLIGTMTEVTSAGREFKTCQIQLALDTIGAQP